MEDKIDKYLDRKKNKDNYIDVQDDLVLVNKEDINLGLF